MNAWHRADSLPSRLAESSFLICKIKSTIIALPDTQYRKVFLKCEMLSKCEMFCIHPAAASRKHLTPLKFLVSPQSNVHLGYLAWYGSPGPLGIIQEPTADVPSGHEVAGALQYKPQPLLHLIFPVVPRSCETQPSGPATQPFPC